MDILRYAGRRLLQTLPVLFGITLIVFFMLRLIPGDPAAQMLGSARRSMTQENIDHGPASTRSRSAAAGAVSCSFLGGIVRGDLGQSFFFKQPVLPLVLERVPVTLWLVLYAALLISLCDLSRRLDRRPQQGSTGRSRRPRASSC